MSDNGFRPPGYENIVGAATKGTGEGAGALRGAIIWLTTLFMLLLDLMLSSSLVIGQSANQLPSNGLDRTLYMLFGVGSNLSVWGRIIPWLFSLGTTGLVYALWNPPKDHRKSYIRLIGWAMALADSCIDVGGLNGLITQDPDSATNIIPSKSMTPLWYFLDIFVFVLCFMQEPLLRKLLSDQQGRVKTEVENNEPGAKTEDAFLTASGYTFSFVTAVALLIGSAGLISLDLVLTPQGYSSNSTATVVMWLLSFIIFGLQVMCWRYVHRVRRAGNKVSNDATGKLVFAGIFSFSVIDTFFDLSGYNRSLYGTSKLIVPQPTVVWALTACMIIIMTLFGEPLVDTIFGNLWKHFWTGGGAKSPLSGIQNVEASLARGTTSPPLGGSGMMGGFDASALFEPLPDEPKHGKHGFME